MIASKLNHTEGNTSVHHIDFQFTTKSCI